MFFNHYMFAFLMALGHSGVHTWTWTGQGNSGNKVGKWQFLDLKSHNCVEFCVFNVFS